MAKYEVTFSCGHTQRIELFGKDIERRRKIAFYESEGLCSDCYKKSLRGSAPVVENGCLILDYAEQDGAVRRVKTGYKNGQMTYREIGADENFVVRIPIGEMSGSEKQVAWALDIKRNFIKGKFEHAMENVDLMVETVKKLKGEDSTLQDAVDMAISNRAAWRDFLLEPSAKTVIDISESGKILRL